MRGGEAKEEMRNRGEQSNVGKKKKKKEEKEGGRGSCVKEEGEAGTRGGSRVFDKF